MGLPRINYANDGTKLYSYFPSAATKTIHLQDDINILDGDIYVTSNIDSNPSTNGNYHLMWNFPSGIQIDKIGVKQCFNDSGGSPILTPVTGLGLWYSNDSTDGIDGTWVEYESTFSATRATYTEWDVNITSCKWLRGPLCTQNYNWYNIFIFGEYTDPSFEIYDAAGTIELNATDYPLGVTSISSLYDYSNRQQFKIKNKTAYTKNYSISITPIKYGGDAIITNNFSLSIDGGTTKSQTVILYNIAPNSLCNEIIDVWVDLLAENNTADGYHYYSVVIEEV